MKRTKLSVAGWRRQLFDHLGMSTLGEEALRLADGMAQELRDDQVLARDLLVQQRLEVAAVEMIPWTRSNPPC